MDAWRSSSGYERLADDLDVTDEVMDLDAARALGAMALFGEKYGKRVRVVSIGGDWSKDLWPRTHVQRSRQLGLVTVLGESPVGSAEFAGSMPSSATVRIATRPRSTPWSASSVPW